MVPRGSVRETIPARSIFGGTVTEVRAVDRPGESSSAVAGSPASPRGAIMVDVAKLAGVSQKTVSRVVNDAPHVRPDVRARVNAAIAQLGYQPNVAAQALRRNRTYTIGMLAVGTSHYGPARRVFSIEQATRRHGYGLTLATLPDLEPATVADGIASLLARGVEGLVVEVPTLTDALDLSRLGHLPVVSTAAGAPGLRHQTVVVDVDEQKSARAVTEYLLGLGHETVWHIAGPQDWAAAAKRRQGWRSALGAAGRRVPRVRYGDWSARSGYLQGRKLMAQDGVTAIFVANDHMAMGVLRAVTESGRRIPEDVSVVGYDDVPEAEFQMIPLSTVATDAERAAERILSELVTIIEGGKPPASPIDLPFSLVIRSSSGPPAAKV
jgi:DNA-binding LacI/PurR family transcriptional regulator